MAAQSFYVMDGDSNIIRVRNGSFYTSDMSSNLLSKCHVYVEFYSDANGTQLATPTAGSITCFASPMGNAWMDVNSGVIDAKLAGSEQTYNVPTICGRVQKGRVILNNIAGAAYAKVLFWTFE